MNIRDDWDTQDEDPSNYDWDLLNLVHELIKIVNDLRGRMIILEREVFNG